MSDTHSTRPRVFRNRRPADVIVLLTILLHTIFFFSSTTAFLIVAGFATFLLGLSLHLRDPMAIQITLLTLAIAISRIILPWPFFSISALIMYGTIATTTSYLRQTLFWCRIGKLNLTIWRKIILTVLISSSALLMFVFFLLCPNYCYILSKIFSYLPARSPTLLILSGLSFAVISAVIEESIYRGVIMQGTDSVVGINYYSVILQAIPFAFIHINGVLGGWISLCLATIYGIYGLMLGQIRHIARGMLAPFLTHIFVDTVIFCSLAPIGLSMPILD